MKATTLSRKLDRRKTVTAIPSLFPELDRRKTVTLVDLSEQSGIPLRTIQDHVAKGEIVGAFRSGKGKGRKWRIRRSDAEIWWQEMQRAKV